MTEHSPPAHQGNDERAVSMDVTAWPELTLTRDQAFMLPAGMVVEPTDLYMKEENEFRFLEQPD